MMKPLVIKEIVKGKIKGEVETIKMTRVEIRSSPLDSRKEKSSAQYWERRQVLVPVFENGKYDWRPRLYDLDEMAELLGLGRDFYAIFIDERDVDREYYWVPSEEEIKGLVKKKHEIDKINSDRHRKHHGGIARDHLGV